MKTILRSGKEFLESQGRAERRVVRKRREIRPLIEAAGKDGFNPITFEENTPQRTRRRSTSQDSAIPKVFNPGTSI